LKCEEEGVDLSQGIREEASQKELKFIMIMMITKITIEASQKELKCVNE